MTSLNSLFRWIPAIGVLVLSIAPATGYGESYTDVAIGGYSLCTLSVDGSPRCNVADHATRLAVPDGIGQFTSLSAGQTHICGITIDNTVRCWGDNFFSQQQVPATTASFIQLDAGRDHTCAVDSNDTLWCWGLDDSNQATPPDDGLGFIQVAAGSVSSCGIRTDRLVDCWGSDESVRQVPADLGFIIDIDVGRQSACGLSIDGSVQCWGVRAGILAGGPYTSIAVTVSSVCGLQANGKIVCNFNDQGLQSEFFDTVSEDRSFTAIESGLAGTCGLLNDGDLLCWGTQLTLTESVDSFPPPYDLQTFQYSDTRIELMWHASGSSYAVGFNIYRNGELLAFTENETSFIDNTLVPGIEYSYRIAQILFDGRQSELSEPTDAGASILPAVGLDLSAKLYSSSALELFWSTSPSVTIDSTEIEFTVERNGVVVYTGDGRSYFDEGLLPKTRYRYTIAVSNSAQMSAAATLALVTLPSSRITSSRPTAPNGLTVEVYSSSALELFWDRSEAFTAIEVYEVSRDGFVIATSNGISFFHANLQAMTTYNFNVVAIDIFGQRSNPTSVELTTRP